MIPTVVQRLADPHGQLKDKMQVQDAIVLDGEQQSEPAAPVLTAAPIRSKKVGVLVHAPGSTAGPMRDLRAARDALCRRLGPFDMYALALGVRDTPAFNEVLGIETNENSRVMCGVALCGKEVRYGNAPAAKAPAHEEFGTPAHTYCLKFGTTKTNSKHVPAIIAQTVEYALASPKTLSNVELKEAQARSLKQGSLDADLWHAEHEELDLEGSSTAEEAMEPALAYLEVQQPAFMLKGRPVLVKKWTRMWQDVNYPRVPQPPPKAFKAFPPLGYQQAATEEVKLDPVERRILYNMSMGENYRLGKTTLLEHWSRPDWWKDVQQHNFPGVCMLQALQNMHHFVPVYDKELILAFHFERGGVQSMSAAQKTFVLELTDDAQQKSGKCRGSGHRVVGHVVVLSNEPPPPEWMKKEIWLLELANGAHLRNECVWHFPGEPPSQRAVVGKVGRVARPYSVNDQDPEKAAAARMLTKWQEDSCRVYTLEDLPTPKRQKMDVLSPDSKTALNSLLREASLADGLS